MKKHYWLFKLLAIIALTASIYSCKKEVEYSGLTGELKGTTTLYGGGSAIADYSGITVTVEGSSPKLQATTNEKGEFDIKGLKTGIYDIVFTKGGYATYKAVSYQFIGGNTPSYASAILAKLPDVKILDVKVDTVSYDHLYYTIYVNGTLSAAQSVSLQYYISDSPDVSYTNYQASSVDFCYNSKNIWFRMDNTFLAKFPQGKQLYIRFYPAISTSSTFSYIDIATGLRIYPVNPDCGTEAIPFMIPKIKSTY